MTPGEQLRIVVGGNGRTTDGFNGGGSPNGGGASDIRQDGSSLTSRIVVAGGGGGSGGYGEYNVGGQGGPGGGLLARDGESANGGGGGTQSAGGFAGSGMNGDLGGTSGTLSQGGSGYGNGGGGGGGYYGGGGGGGGGYIPLPQEPGAGPGGGGGGGSSYIAPSAIDVRHDVGFQPGNGVVVVSYRRAGGDFNGDGASDKAVYRPATGTWYVQGATPVGTQHGGDPTDVPVPGDYDGNGSIDQAIFRPSTGVWYVRGGAPEATSYGAVGDVPVPGDYDGNGTTDKAVYRPSTGMWYVLGGLPSATHFGTSSDLPVPEDYDGDGRTDIAVYRPFNGSWYVLGQTAPTQYGGLDDIPVPDDYNSDGLPEFAVYRPTTGTWYVRFGSPESTQYGAPGDIPVPADYNADGATEKAVYRPATGTWFVRGGLPEAVQYGSTGDIPASWPLPVALYRRTVTDVATSDDYTEPGGSVTLTATVQSSTATPSGSVSFSSLSPSSQTLGTVPLVDGAATLTLNTLPRGFYRFTALYSGSTSAGMSESDAVPFAVVSTPGLRSSAAGDFHSLAIMDDGTVTARGKNGAGQLGNNQTNDSAAPVVAAGLTDVVSVSAGGAHSLALDGEGTVWAWGDNTDGQAAALLSVPVREPLAVAGVEDVIGISAGANHSLAVTATGSVFSWGSNSSGQLGDGSTITRSSPVQVPGVDEIVAVAAGAQHSVALAADGSVWTWGVDPASPGAPAPVPAEGTGASCATGSPQVPPTPLGGGATLALPPTRMAGLSDVIAIAAGDMHSLALKSDGTVWAWGRQSVGELGTGTTVSVTSPVKVPQLGGVTQIGAGGRVSMATTSDGQAWVWGYGEYGQLGNGSFGSTAVPVAVQGLPAGSKSIGLDAGIAHDLFLVDEAPGPSAVGGGQLVDGKVFEGGLHPAEMGALCNPPQIRQTSVMKSPVIKGILKLTVGTSLLVIVATRLFPCGFQGIGFIAYGPTDPITISGDTYNRPTGAIARVVQFMLRTGTRTSSRYNPPGWAIYHTPAYVRGHLLAKVLGGSGTEPRNIVALRALANNQMQGIEQRVRNRVIQCEPVNYFVAAVNVAGLIKPSSVTVSAQGDRGFVIAPVTISNI